MSKGIIIMKTVIAILNHSEVDHRQLSRDELKALIIETLESITPDSADQFIEEHEDIIFSILESCGS